MASSSFHLSIVLPTRKVFEGSVSEVVLPAYDGEVGILPNHESFVGILGTGPLKYIHEGKDYWLAISSGVFKVSGQSLSVLAESAEKGEELSDENVKGSSAKIHELEAELAKKSEFTNEAQSVSIRLQRERARLEVYRRTNLLN